MHVMRGLLILWIFFSALARAQGLPKTVHYLGAIDGTKHVSMHLTFDHENVSGTYAYAVSGKDLFLKGRSEGNDARRIALTESTRWGETTGHFQLTERVDGALAGTWTSADKKRTFAVSLSCAARGITLAASRTGRYSVQTQYLRFPRETPFYKSVNAALEKEATQTQQEAVKEMIRMTRDEPSKDGASEWSESIDPRLLFADESLVSIRLLKSEYTGGAHNNYQEETLNYAWRNGILVKDPPFLTRSDATAALLTKMTVRDLRAQHALWADELALDKNVARMININPVGIVLTFSPYEVGPFADGSYVVVLSWKNAASLVPADSPLARFVHR